MSLALRVLLEYLSASKWLILPVAPIGFLGAIAMLIDAVKKEP